METFLLSKTYWFCDSGSYDLCARGGCRCEDKESKAALKLLCDLYALDRIWSDIGTYRNEDYVAPNKAKVQYYPAQ